jgi:LPS-assembly protein
VFANFAELTGDLQEGFIRDIRILLSDRSRLAAATGTRTGGNRSILKSGVFSPCELCREDPTRAPLWQIKAAEVEHDQAARVIRYRDAWMEIFGVPVIYTPYFEHPDPTVDRQSGFLAPTFGASEVLGSTYQQPYFWAISKDRDFTFSPIFTTKRGVVGVGKYRHIFPNGTMDLRGSATIADRERNDGSIESDVFRGHIDSSARFDINDSYRMGVDVQRVTDDTYQRLYDFSTEQDLTSRAFIEGFNGRNYLAVNNYLYQGLRSTDLDSELPIIHPLAEYNYMSDPGVAGGKYTLDASLLALTRSEGRDSRRVSVALGWELPYTGPAGDVYNLVARVQGDG